MTMHTLEALGWQWRANGAILCIQLDGQKHQVFVPLNRIWHEFHKELAAVGCPLPIAVGEEITVSGLFSSISKAVSGAAKGVAKVANSAAKAVTSNAITKAAASVATTATNYAAHAVAKIPVVGSVASSVTRLMTAPLNVAEALAKGGRIDRVAMTSLQQQIKDIRTVAPYAQTVLTFVPGVGTGLSGAIGAGLALANGQNITDALVAGVRGALPGGPLAAAAFDVANAAMQGKPITAIALQAIPGLSPAQKAALVQGVALAKDLAAGKNVSQAVIDAATNALPPDAKKAVQIGAALAHAKNLQGAVGALTAASGLQKQFSTGVAAALQIKALPAHITPPKALTQAVQAGLDAKAKTLAVVKQAQAGNPAAAKVAAAMQFNRLSPPVPASTKPGARFVRARYHTTPQTQAQASVGAMWPAGISRAVMARQAARPNAYQHPIANVFQQHAFAHHHAHHQVRQLPAGSFMAPRAIFAHR